MLLFLAGEFEGQDATEGDTKGVDGVDGDC